MIPKQLVHLRYIRASTLAIVDRLSQAQLDFSPQNQSGEWSIGQILDHIHLTDKIIYEDVSELIDLTKTGKTAYIYRSFADLDGGPKFIPKSILPYFEPMFFLLNRFPPNSINIRGIFPTFALPCFELPLSVIEQVIPTSNSLLPSLAPLNLVPFRNPTRSEPTKDKPGEELRASLCESLRLTEALFESNASLDFNTMTREHPLFGIQTVPQFLTFVEIEERLHHEQIVNVISEPLFPQNTQK